MRSITRTVVAAAALAFVAVALLGTSGAGAAELNSFTVEKVVEGPVPDGAVFEVEVTCEHLETDGAAEATADPPQVTVKFDASGNPLDANTVMTPAGTKCTAVETVTNGAAVSYACAFINPDPASLPSDNGIQPVACTDDQTVQFGYAHGEAGTVTVTNTFEEEPPPPSAVAPAAAAPTGVVAARPAFTG